MKLLWRIFWEDFQQRTQLKIWYNTHTLVAIGTLFSSLLPVATLSLQKLPLSTVYCIYCLINPILLCTVQYYKKYIDYFWMKMIFRFWSFRDSWRAGHLTDAGWLLEKKKWHIEVYSNKGLILLFFICSSISMQDNILKVELYPMKER